MTKTNAIINKIQKMDTTILMKTNENIYNEWLEILGNYYETTNNFRTFVKERLTTKYLNELEGFYNKVMF